MSGTLRHDYYQTETLVAVSIFSKGVTEDKLTVSIGERSLHVVITNPDGSESALTLDPLFSSVKAQASSYRILSTKVEVTLHKAAPGLSWASLKGEAGAVGAGNNSTASTPKPSSIPAATTPSAPAASTSSAAKKKNKWDSIDYESLAGKTEKEDSDINAFFRKIYKDADEDTRKAMMKSFQESNGTALSTNWSEVGKGKVGTKPPEGMEAKDY